MVVFFLRRTTVHHNVTHSLTFSNPGASRKYQVRQQVDLNGILVYGIVSLSVSSVI
jgi:hypothetical protein